MRNAESAQLSLFKNPATIRATSGEPLRLGQHFTPRKWAAWLLAKAGVLETVDSDKTYFDPTGGTGAFVFALCDSARQTRRLDLEKIAGRIFLCEVDRKLVRAFQERFHAEYGFHFPRRNIFPSDFLFLNSSRKTYDVVCGNPPWCNFADLPTDYKEKVKPLFNESGLNPDRRALLLGSSRVDLAALIIVRAIGSFLKPSGVFLFFAPISLFLGDAAHNGFRRYHAGGAPFSITDIYEFAGNAIFPGVSTRYCAFHGRRNEQQEFPVRFHVQQPSGWRELLAFPLGDGDSQLSIDDWKPGGVVKDTRIELRIDQKPRQGANTCGANDVFIFDYPPGDLPREFLFPLIGSKLLTAREQRPERFILIPHDRQTGRPLSEAQVRAYPSLWDFLLKNKARLQGRKGTLLRSWIEKGLWWALLGVGRYSMSPFKVVWTALGAKEFRPAIVSSWEGVPWQGNQALHAYVPCQTLEEAEGVLRKLDPAHIQERLVSLRMAGSRNWAQPGKVSKLIDFVDDKGLFHRV